MRAVLVTLSLAYLGCAGVLSINAIKDLDQEAQGITLFLSGQEQGQLKPCGCSGGQLGGLERRGAIFAQVPAEHRMILHTGSVIPEETEQNLIKFPVFFQAFSLLRYDCVHLTRQDLQMDQMTGALAGMDPSIGVITADPTASSLASVYERRYTLGGRDVTVQVIAVGEQTALPTVREQSQVRVFILDRADETLLDAVLSVAGGEDCVIIPSELDDPKVHEMPGAEALVLSVGRRGRHVGRLDIHLGAESEGVTLRFQTLPVAETLITDPLLADLYKSYQGIVRDSRLIDRVTRVPLPNGERYMGSESCQNCHEEVYAIWKDRGHAKAYETLVKVGSDMDPECVVCHVVGMEFEEGFISLEETPQLIDVGCEVCHGPGAQHVISGGSIEMGQPRRECLHCHTPEHSGAFAEQRHEYVEKIRHW